MSRSRKQTPITGMTTAETDKPFKAQEHRRARRATKIAIAGQQDPPHRKAFGSSWDAPKDGKQWRPDDPRAKRK
jgi:hypothetical protein